MLLGCASCQGEHTADTRTAGSITLLAQTALPCMLFATGAGPCTLHLKGGTDTQMAPPVDYLLHVLLPTLRSALGVHITASLKKRGFYPKGGGELMLTAAPVSRQAGMPPLNLVHRGRVSEVRATVFVAGTIPPAVGQRMADAAKAALLAAEVAGVSPGCVSVDIVQETRDSAFGDGCGITLVAETDTGCLLGASALGERGKRAEDVGREAATELAAVLKGGACVDSHLADQLVIFMALAGHGTARMLAPAPLSLHCRTAIAVTGQMTTAKFTVLEAGERSADDGTEAVDVQPGTCLVICQYA
jgi:RNA 3'-terminal phosphate cyclase (ATP)